MTQPSNPTPATTAPAEVTLDTLAKDLAKSEVDDSNARYDISVGGVTIRKIGDHRLYSREFYIEPPVTFKAMDYQGIVAVQMALAEARAKLVALGAARAQAIAASTKG